MHTPGPERSAIYELLRYGRKHDGPWTEAITGDQLIDEEYADLFAAAPDMLAALEYDRNVLAGIVMDNMSDPARAEYALALTKSAIAKAEGRNE